MLHYHLRKLFTTGLNDYWPIVLTSVVYEQLLAHLKIVIELLHGFF